eukprot:9178057-Alexandrium_andersonii.AAC.1
MADQWAERPGFSQLSASNDKDGLELLVDIRRPGAEDLFKCIQTKSSRRQASLSQASGELAEHLGKI